MPRRPETAEVSKSNDVDIADRAHEYRSADTPAGTIVISDHATLKVFYDPMRQRILRVLYTPMSVTELGEQLGESPNRLYYHVRLLEKHGLIAVAEERRAGSNLERLYGRAATRYELSPELVEQGNRLAAAVSDGLFERLIDRFRRNLLAEGRPGERDIRLVLTHVKQISHERIEELGERMDALFSEYFGPDAPGDESGGRYAHLTMVLPEVEADGADL